MKPLAGGRGSGARFPPMRRPIPVLICLLLAACATGPSALRARLDKLIGQPLSAVIAAEGVPDKSYQTDGVTYLAYLRRRVDFVPSVPFAGPPGFLGWYAAPPPTVIQWRCDTTFEIAGGVVRRYTLNGNACD